MPVITTNTNGGADYVKFLNKTLLDQTFPLLKLQGYGKKFALPTGNGNKTVSMYRRNKPSSANVQNITEGVPISTFTNMTLAEVPVTLFQYGEAIRISDLANKLSVFNQEEMATSLLAEDLAIKVDDTTRNELVLNATQKKYSSGTSFANLSAAGSAPMTFNDIIATRTSLRINNVPFFNGSDYIAVIPSIVYHDLLKDATLREYFRYVSEDQRVFKGELGSIGNIRLIEAGNPFIESATEGSYDAAGNIYSTLVFGKDAYGIVDLSGESAYAPSMKVVNKPDAANPLGQFESLGYLAYFAPKLLNTEFLTVLRSKTSYV